MSEAKHTPGPWRVDGQFDAEVSASILAGEEPIHITEVEPFLEDWTEEEIANAHLIAAAPELPEALTKARRELALVASNSNFTLYPNLLSDIDATIAKAEGRS